MDASIHTQAQPLSDRSTNTLLQSAQSGTKQVVDSSTTAAPYSMDFHRKTLQQKLQDGSDQYVLLQEQKARRSDNASYVSPSDDIMSPCTKKLSDLKGKRFKNAGKPTSLFTKLGKKSFEQSSSSAMSAAVKDGE